MPRRVDVLVVVGLPSAPPALHARAARVVTVPAGGRPAAVLDEVGRTLPRVVGVVGVPPEATEVARLLGEAGLRVTLFVDGPADILPGVEVVPAHDQGPAMDVVDTVLDLVGDTPMVRLDRVGRDLSCQLLAKLEYLNPGGSVKDRPALEMVRAAERSGVLVPGGTIVEPTSGNTGLALAMIAALRGYRCIFTMPDKVAEEKRALLRSFGAEVVVCPTAVAPEDPESYYSVAARLAASTPGGFEPNQYQNPANPEAHERGTGPEIWRQTNGRVTHFVAGVGTGGTVSGVARFLKAQNPAVQVVAADPEGSIYSGGGGRPYLVEGIGEDFWPATYDPSLVDRVVAVSDRDSFLTARRVTREEGILVGGSTGTAVWAALEVGRELGPQDVVVVLVPDSGRGYLTKLYDDEWMAEHGFVEERGETVASVLAVKGQRTPSLVHVHPEETVRSAIAVMDEYGVSQLLVVKAEPPLALAEVVGSVTDQVLVDRGLHHPEVLDQPVSSVMGPPLPTIGWGETVELLAERLRESPAAVVLDSGHPVGIVTRSDLLAFMERS